MRRSGIWLFLGLAAAVGIAALLAPRADLPLSYHQFADQRSWLGVPNFGDVASNLVYIVLGVWGLTFLFRDSSREQFIDARERWPYVFVFLGLFLTAFGSAYYHLAPDNERLVWDRLPLTLVFMSLVTALITEGVSVRFGLWSLPVLMAVGIGSVMQWRLSVQHGAGDVRFYAAVQVYFVLALCAALLLCPRYTRGSDLAWVFAFYAIAKIAETADRQIFSMGNIVSGHTIKQRVRSGLGICVLRNREDRGDSRQADFLYGEYCERAHDQTLVCWRRGILDPANATEEATSSAVFPTEQSDLGGSPAFNLGHKRVLHRQERAGFWGRVWPWHGCGRAPSPSGCVRLRHLKNKSAEAT